MPHPFDAFNPATACYRDDKPVVLPHAARLAYNDAAACESFAAQFGGPRVGNRAVERTFDQSFGARNFRFHNNADLVTRVPLRAMGFSHAGSLLYTSDKGKLMADPGLWYAFLNRMRGRIEDLGNMGPADLKGHAIDHYVTLCDKNRAVKPF